MITIHLRKMVDGQRVRLITPVDTPLREKLYTLGISYLNDDSNWGKPRYPVPAIPQRVWIMGDFVHVRTEGTKTERPIDWLFNAREAFFS